MSKSEMIELEGTVTESYPNATFEVTMASGHKVLAGVAGKLRMNSIRVYVGDYVKVEVSPYDLSKGRIVFRYK